MTTTTRSNISTALRLFASIFQREVDDRLLSELRTCRQKLLASLGNDPLAGLDLGDSQATLQALAVEYCQLFIGPGGHLPPVESVVLGEGGFWGATTEQVVDFYHSVEISLPRDGRMLPDHLSMELDCLAVLEETNRGDKAGVFAREHILRWLPSLIQHVTERGTIAFYRVWATGLQTMLLELYEV